MGEDRRRSPSAGAPERIGATGRAADLAAALSRLAPRLPRFETLAVLDQAMGSPGLRGAAPETAARLSLIAYARHALTDYDALLEEGYDRDSARHFVLDEMNAALAQWGAKEIDETEIDEPEIGSEVAGDGDGPSFRRIP